MITRKIKTNIKKFNISSNIFLFDDGKLSLANEGKKVDSFVAFENEILIIYSEEEKVRLNFPNIPENYDYKNFSASKSYFILYDMDSFDLNIFRHTKEAIYSLKEKKIIYEEGSIIGDIIINDFVLDGIGFWKNHISIFSIINKSIITTFPLSTLSTWLDGAIEKPYQVNEFCGIYNKTLVCTLNSGSVLLLDIEKGEILKFIKDAKFPRMLYVDHENENIYKGLFGRRYIELDVNIGVITREVIIEDQLRKLKGINDETVFWASIGRSYLYDGLFYFGIETNDIGIFDPVSAKIIDYHEFDFDKSKGQQLRGGKENLQVKDGEIYCLDTLGNLYKLESEK